jgi:hypothetical protein
MEALITEEIDTIISLSSEIVQSIERLDPTKGTPQVRSFKKNVAEPRYAKVPGYNHSIPLVFDDESVWVIKFPLKSRTTPSLIAQKVRSEVTTTKWVKANTSIPVPTIHGFDADGTAEWNATGRPCIIMDKAYGMTVSESQWRRFSEKNMRKVLTQIAQIVVELSTHHFDRIGSLFEDEEGHVSVGPMLAESMNGWLKGHEHLELFAAPKSPYSSATHYYHDLANMRLLFEATRSSTLSEPFIHMWICRSLLPSCIVNDFDSGPFMLRHGLLMRDYVFFDRQLKVSCVINWEWSRVVPAQTMAAPTPFVAIPPYKLKKPVDFDWHRTIRFEYIQALPNLESAFNKDEKSPPILFELNKNAMRTLSLEKVLAGGELYLASAFWIEIFAPIFGDIDKAAFIQFYKKAPGVLDEFKRMRKFISLKDVFTA